MYSVPRAAITKCLRPGWLKTTETYCVTVLEAGSGKVSVSRSMLSLKDLQRICSVLLSLLPVFVGNLALPWFIKTSVQSLPPSSHGLLPSASVYLSFSF